MKNHPRYGYMKPSAKIIFLLLLLMLSSCAKGQVKMKYLSGRLPGEVEIEQWYLSNLETEAAKSLTISCNFTAEQKADKLIAYYKRLLENEKITETEDVISISGNMKNKSRVSVNLREYALGNKTAVTGLLSMDRVPYQGGKHLNADDVFSQETIRLKGASKLLVKQAYQDLNRYGISYYSKEKYKTIAIYYERIVKKLNESDIQKDIPISYGEDSKMWVMTGKTDDSLYVTVKVWEWDEKLGDNHYFSYVEVDVKK